MSVQILEHVYKKDNLFCYNWFLVGFSGRKSEIRNKLINAGWQWIPGSRLIPNQRNGRYVTEDYALARQTLPHIFGQPSKIVSDGSHTEIAVAMYKGEFDD